MSDTIRKKIKFEYYRVVSTRRDERNARDGRFDLRLWISRAIDKSLEERTLQYQDERARLEQAGFDPEVNFWYLHFIRLRDAVLPSRVKVATQAEPLVLDADEYLGEEVTGLYDDSLDILIIQRNHASLGHSGLEKYMNALWGSDDETIHLRPIRSVDAESRALESPVFKRLTVRFADADNIDSINNAPRLGNMLNMIRDFGGVTGEVVVSLGRKRNASLSKETVSDWISQIKANRHFVSKAEVSVEDHSGVEMIDLFDELAHGYRYFNIPRRTTLQHAAVFADMAAMYRDDRRRIAGYVGAPLGSD